MERTLKLHEAMIFAAQAHKGQVRKGSDIPYLVHLMEVLHFLTQMQADETVLIAGVLHDAAEDTDVTLGEIKQNFGEDVATLIKAHSEDKGRTWLQRKTEMIRVSENGSKSVKMLVLADILSNMYSIYADLMENGDIIWEKFNAPRDKQSWYYSAMLDTVEILQEDVHAAKVYWEATAIYKDIFVRYYITEDRMTILQATEHGENTFLKKTSPQWVDFLVELPEHLIPIERLTAEKLEDEWCKEFWDQFALDMIDWIFVVDEKDEDSLTINMTYHMLFVDAVTYEQDVQSNLHYELDMDNTQRFMVQLRMNYGIEISLEDLLNQCFGMGNGIEAFIQFCSDFQIEYVSGVDY